MSYFAYGICDDYDDYLLIIQTVFKKLAKVYYAIMSIVHVKSNVQCIRQCEYNNPRNNLLVKI